MQNTLYYIETSIPSFYYDTRSNIQAQAMRAWTRQWWHKPRENAILLIGAPVIAELQRTPEPKRGNTLQLIKDLFLLDYDESIDEIISAYITHKLMPTDAMGDALTLRWHRFTNAIFW
jgi:hypothetical protein